MTSRPLQVLLLSPYDAYSHQQWRETLVSMFPEFDWTVLTLPPRYFAWRVRGNSLSWAYEQRQNLERQYDLLICTSLTDLSGLRGLLPPLATIPTLVYFHENQFAYPTNGTDATADDKPSQKKTQPSHISGGDLTPASVEAAMLSLYTALCADQILFNSEWNLRSFLSGSEQLLRKLPDHVPSQVTELIAQKAAVLSVPLPDSLYAMTEVEHASSLTTPLTLADKGTPAAPLNIVWNHRHEYDKGPDLLLAIVQRLIRSDLSCRFHLLGQRFRQRPEAFNEIDRLLTAYYEDRGITPGVNRWLKDRNAYLAQLRSADVVLSTALHDFQGLAVQEACVLGCVPLVPDALAYPEFIPSVYRFEAKGSLEQQAESAFNHLLLITSAFATSRPTASDPAFATIDLRQLKASQCRDNWLTYLNKLL